MQGFIAFKYVGAERAVQCLEDGTLYLASPDQLNDALEARFSTASAESYLATVEATLAEVARQRDEPPLSLSRDALLEFNDVNQQENERFQAFCEGIGICALTKRPNHQAMWAYYGECGEGVCLELTLPSEVMKSHQLLAGPVTYCDAPRVLNRAEDWRTVVVKYFWPLPFEHSSTSLLPHWAAPHRYVRAVSGRYNSGSYNP